MYGATRYLAAVKYARVISTHAPYVRGDVWRGLVGKLDLHFNPRPVCTGRRPEQDVIGYIDSISTHAPYVRGDSAASAALSGTAISTHAPYVRGDATIYTAARDK